MTNAWNYKSRKKVIGCAFQSLDPDKQFYLDQMKSLKYVRKMQSNFAQLY